MKPAVSHLAWPKVRMDDGKKRRIRIIRPSLQEVKAKVGILNRNAKFLRGVVRRASNTNDQLQATRGLEQIKRERGLITGYLEALAFGPGYQLREGSKPNVVARSVAVIGDGIRRIRQVITPSTLP